jgi:competence protein ComEA
VEKIILFLRQFGWAILMGVVGGSILLYGVWEMTKGDGSTVEIVKGQVAGSQSGVTTQIVVDVAGALEHPGVYHLPSGSRIGDALVMAGGLSASADREWVAKTMNLAEILKDGAKVYIPAKVDGKTLGVSVIKEEAGSGKVNINTATVSELDSLTGIGEVRAKSIVDNRPYGNIDELVSKAKIPQSVYDKIKDSISIY